MSLEKTMSHNTVNSCVLSLHPKGDLYPDCSSSNPMVLHWIYCFAQSADLLNR